MFKDIKKLASRIFTTSKNAMTLPREYLKYGSRRGIMKPDWSQVTMSDQDHYTGLSYAGITKRARTVARVAKDHLVTEKEGVANAEEVHPYIPLIRESKLFSENFFWQAISIFLDLEGVFYIYALRNFDDKKTGNTLQFKLLNPYNIKRVLDKDTLQVVGYIENRKGFQRELPKEQIIEIRELNPFDEDKPYSMTDAAKENSFTLKSSGDYTRHILRNNVDAPGIITTDVILSDEQFKNFVSRMKEHTKGEPIFGNGAGAVNWQPMTSDLSKAGLKDINEINRESLFAVLGMSKTMMGIEQSGVTRETGHVQKELFIESEAVPRIDLIIDALNLDYKSRYSADYEKNKLTLGISNPIESDQEIEGKKIDNKTKNYDLYMKLVNDGYDEKKASQFANGEIDIKELGKPKNPPKVDPLEETPVAKKEEHLHEHKHLNQITQAMVDDQQSKLQNAIVNIEGRLAVAAINRIPKLVKNGLAKNQIDEESDLITAKEKKDSKEELMLLLFGFYAAISKFHGKDTIVDRLSEFGGKGRFSLDKLARDNMKDMSEKVASSHVDTISKELYQVARKAALEGRSQLEIIGELKSRYSHDITENRAKTVARTETNRAFTMAQYDADRQFISQNNLEGRAFKRWETRSDNPCEFCLALEAQGLVPFEKNFVNKGDSVSAKVDGKKVSFEAGFDDVYSGNLHPNCSCDYRLVILPEK